MRKKPSLPFLLISALLFVFLSLPALTSAQSQGEPYRVTSPIPANIRVAPALDADRLGSLVPGTIVYVVSGVEGVALDGNTLWYEIALNERRAYIHSSLVTSVAGEGVAPATAAAETPVVVTEPTTVPATPLPARTTITVNPNASARTQALLRYFYSLPGRSENRVISGQFGAYGDGTSRETAQEQLDKIHDQTGLWPALTGMDYARWDLTQQANFAEPNGFLIDQWNAGSLINISWHSPNPWTNGPSTDWENRDTEDPYDTRDVMELVNPGPVHDRWIVMLDDIANGLQALEDAGVVVIWRPLHEMNGGWAWWHRQTPEAYVALWRQMFDYFTYEKGLNNLLWAYAPNAVGNEFEPRAMFYYPGDDYVDLVGLDKYMALGEDPLQINNFGEYDELVATGKPMNLFEFGPIPASGQGWDSFDYDYGNLIRDIKNLYPRIVLFQAWEYVWQIGEHANAAGLMNDDWVITRDELDW